MADGRIEVRSYRTVFDLERRLYRIDRIRLNPGGVPVRAVVYAIALAAVVAVLNTLPLLGAGLGLLPWPARELGLPVLLAAVATMVRVDGRPLHVAAGSLLRLVAGPRRLSAFRPTRRAERWRPSPLPFIGDGSEARPRRARFTGPGAVVVAVAHDLREARLRRRVALRPRPGAPAPTERRVIALAPRARLDVRAPRRA